jgi:hypothetical protein
VRASEGGGAAARARAHPLWPQGLTRVPGALQRVGVLEEPRALDIARRRTLNPRLACWWTGSGRARVAANSPLPRSQEPSDPRFFARRSK